jgi:hypothetical protein
VGIQLIKEPIREFSGYCRSRVRKDAAPSIPSPPERGPDNRQDPSPPSGYAAAHRFKGS